LFGPYAGVSETFTITYRYYSDGSSVQAFLQSEAMRAPGANNYIKIIPPYALQFDDFKIKTTLTVDQVKTYIKDYVNSLDKKFELSDLYYHLYNKGITYIETEDVDIKVRGYDYRTYQLTDFDTDLGSRQLISGLGAFYSHSSDLLGVQKVNG